MKKTKADPDPFTENLEPTNDMIMDTGPANLPIVSGVQIPHLTAPLQTGKAIHHGARKDGISAYIMTIDTIVRHHESHSTFSKLMTTETSETSGTSGTHFSTSEHTSGDNHTTYSSVEE